MKDKSLTFLWEPVTPYIYQTLTWTKGEICEDGRSLHSATDDPGPPSEQALNRKTDPTDCFQFKS